MVEEPDDVAPVEPLVPELLDVPAEPLLDGEVVVELPDEPMPEREPEVEPLVDGIDEVELAGAPIEDEPLAEPPADPIPEAEPEAVPVELQAARAPAQASAMINLLMRTPS